MKMIMKKKDEKEARNSVLEEHYGYATNKYLRETCLQNNIGAYVVRPYAICADGYRVSIEGRSEPVVRCWPHEDAAEYTHVMVFSPSCEDEELTPYHCEPRWQGKYYDFVPVKVMDKVLEKHGGVVGTKEDDGDLLFKVLYRRG